MKQPIFWKYESLLQSIIVKKFHKTRDKITQFYFLKVQFQ